MCAVSVFNSLKHGGQKLLIVKALTRKQGMVPTCLLAIPANQREKMFKAVA